MSVCTSVTAWGGVQSMHRYSTHTCRCLCACDQTPPPLHHTCPHYVYMFVPPQNSLDLDNNVSRPPKVIATIILIATCTIITQPTTYTMDLLQVLEVRPVASSCR